MIKCFGSGKLLKLLSSILLIGFFGLGVNSFVNAVVYITDYGMTLSPSSYSNPLLLEDNFKLNSILGNIDKDFFYVVHNYNSNSQGYYTFGRKGDRLYGYSNSVGCSSNTVYQGYINKIYKCPCGNPYGYYCGSPDTYINTFSDCVFYSDFSLPVFEGLIEDVSQYGYGMITYNDALNVGGCGPVGFMRTPFSSFENTSDEYWYMIAPDVSDTNNYSLSSSFTLEDVENVINFNSSPLVGGSSSGGGSDNVDINNNLTGDYYYSNCTYQQIFNYAESNGYSDYLCYGGLDNFNLYDSTLTYDPTPGTGKTLGQILSYSNAWDTPQERFTFWNGLYIDRYNSSYNAMWESYPAVYRTWFDLYYRYLGSSLNFDSVREYCVMKSLDIDFNTTYYKGQYFKKTCDYIKNNGQYPYNGTGDSDNVVGVNWVGVGNIGSGDDVVVSSDPTKFIQDFFNKLKENLPTRYDLGGGFLPLYIITFMCAIILFRFLSH